MLSRRVPAAAPPNAWAMALEARRRAGHEPIDLIDQNPTRLGLGGATPELLAALADARGAVYAPDPQGDRRAREAIAGYYAGRGLAVDPVDLVLTASTSEAYAHLFRMLADPGEAVCVPAPSYPLFEPLAALEGLRVETYPLRHADGRWRIDLVDLARTLASGDVRALVCVQPNHPTGTCLDPAERAEIESRCAAAGAALIADEVFGDFLWSCEGSATVRASPGRQPSLLGERVVPTFVLHGLSKLCGMPQLKLGWVALAGPAAARAEARAALEWIADAFLSVGTPVQLALPRLLEARSGFRDAVLARVLAHRSILREAIAGTGATVLEAAGGWTAMIELPEGRAAEDAALALIERDVIVHPSHFYDDPDDAALVVSLIAAPDRFGAAAARIAEAVRRG